MRPALKNLLRGPASTERLELVTFHAVPAGDGSTDVREGILFDASSRRAYPIVDGVPVFLDNSFTQEFLSRHHRAIADHPQLSALSIQAGGTDDWSFSREWREHFDTKSERTWGYTVEERLEQVFMETQTTRKWLDGKVILDAGCGNGALSKAIGDLGAVVVGLDYSSSVLGADVGRGSDRVHFLRGDLQTPPLAEGSFDLIISIGVLHHTPDTLTTFRRVARLAKPGAKFYVWLYRRPEGFLGRYVKMPVYDLLRVVISRCPPTLQAAAVNVYARSVRASHNLRSGGERIPLRDYVVSAYDDLTPLWRHYHTPIQISRWFHECGFTAPTLTHWDNPYGFGVVATRDRQGGTPGIHYGDSPKLWDRQKSVLGRLHSAD